MTTPPLVDPLGRPCALDHLLGSGGEGAVFALRDDPQRVAKVYHRTPSQQTVAKLTALTALANPRLLTLAAWPSGLLHDARTRRVAGFVMPRLIDCQPIHHLYNPVQRLKFFPRAGWAFQVRAAGNLAAAFDEVHKAGCLVGDVNQSNAHVSPLALVRLIDCDSFQVPAPGTPYLCEVGVTHYLPPELQGQSLRGLVRTENHDRFGLAVLLYQLLFVGRHPYAGIYGGAGDPSFEQLIAEFRFAQGPLAPTWHMAPPRHTPSFADIPADLGLLFRRAFERGSDHGTRPRPAEWLTALKQLEQAIAVCPADSGHTYWREASRCVWCRLAEHGGPEYYYGVAGGASAFVVDEAKLQAVLRRLDATKAAAIEYDRDRFAPKPPPTAKPLADEIAGYRNVFRDWLAFFGWKSPWHREYETRRSALDRANAALVELENRWERAVRDYRRRQAEQAGPLLRLIAECRGLTAQHQSELQRLTTNAEAAGRLRHLRLHQLADADIPKIGAGRKQALAAHKILTAADIDRDAIRGIKGFGDTLTNLLIEWRATVLRQFRFDPATAVSAAEQRPLAVKFLARQQQLANEMERRLTQLEALAPACRAALQKQVPAIKKAVVAWAQAEADLRAMERKS